MRGEGKYCLIEEVSEGEMCDRRGEVIDLLVEGVSKGEVGEVWRKVVNRVGDGRTKREVGDARREDVDQFVDFRNVDVSCGGRDGLNGRNDHTLRNDRCQLAVFWYSIKLIRGEGGERGEGGRERGVPEVGNLL